MDKEKKLTDWEVGQELIFFSDMIWERSADFKHSHPEIYAMVKEMALTIGDKFNRMKTHSFGIGSHDSEPYDKDCKRPDVNNSRHEQG